jgi:hypothetical protein
MVDDFLLPTSKVTCDKCYRLVGDFVTENRRYPGSWIPFGSSACLTPREWGIVGATGSQEWHF